MIIPAPGIILCTLIDEKTSGLSTNAVRTGSRLVQGKIVAIGDPEDTKFGATIHPEKYVEVGDTIVFLSYADGYDHITIKGIKYYWVKWEDVRGVTNED